MSSTGKTENLKLSQWELSDPFLMEDINEDFRKIDAGVKAMAMVKLIDVTIQENKGAVMLDLSGIDFTDIVEVHVYYPSYRSANVKINGFSGTLQYYNSNGNWQSAGSTVYSPDGHVTIRNSSGLGGTKGDVYMEGFGKYCVSASTIGALWGITIIANANFSAGDRFVVLGVEA